MKKCHITQKDLEELANFWDTHDITNFEDELEEVKEPVFERRQEQKIQWRKMSPKILQEGALIFWFHSYDAIFENRASVHVGKGSQNDANNAKVWLEPSIEVAKPGCTLRTYDLNRAIKIIEQNHDYLMEQWYEYSGRDN